MSAHRDAASSRATASSWQHASWTDRAAIALSFGFGSGLAPRAPGTFGSLLGLPVGILVHRHALDVAHALGLAPELASSRVVGTTIILAALFALSAWSIHRTERTLHTHDDQRIVIDEILGQAIAVAFVPPSVAIYVLAFALFRALDITKPLAIGWIDEKLPGWGGTLCDDVLAGLVAAPLVFGAYVFGERFGVV